MALDVDTDEEALHLAAQLKGIVGGFKVGPRLVLRFGASLVTRLSQLGPVFVDMKFLDIPTTVVQGIQAAFDSGATLATVHAWNGPATLSELAKLEQRLNSIRPFKILAVTVLTSFSEKTLPPGLAPMSVEDRVVQLATSVLESGLSGLVSSPLEIKILKSRFPNSYLVTPGIRSHADALDDQSRTLSAARAMDLGSNALVIGRPIIKSTSPIQSAQNIWNEIQSHRSDQ